MNVVHHGVMHGGLNLCKSLWSYPLSNLFCWQFASPLCPFYQSLISSVHHFKEPAFSFTIIFWFSISFTSVLMFSISSLLLALSLFAPFMVFKVEDQIPD